MQGPDRLSDSAVADEDASIGEAKNRIVQEIENAIERARENPNMYDKGSYYKYGKR